MRMHVLFRRFSFSLSLSRSLFLTENFIHLVKCVPEREGSCHGRNRVNEWQNAVALIERNKQN